MAIARLLQSGVSTDSVLLPGPKILEAGGTVFLNRALR
jgi:hypothetical protein